MNTRCHNITSYIMCQNVILFLDNFDYKSTPNYEVQIIQISMFEEKEKSTSSDEEKDIGDKKLQDGYVKVDDLKRHIGYYINGQQLKYQTSRIYNHRIEDLLEPIKKITTELLECEKIFDIKWEKVPKVEERLEKLRERVFIVCRNQYKKGLITDKKIEKDMKSIKKTYKGSKVEKGPSSLRTLFFCCGHDDQTQQTKAKIQRMEREIGHLLDELKSKNFFKDEFMKNLSLKFKKNQQNIRILQQTLKEKDKQIKEFSMQEIRATNQREMCNREGQIRIEYGLQRKKVDREERQRSKMIDEVKRLGEQSQRIRQENAENEKVNENKKNLSMKLVGEIQESQKHIKNLKQQKHGLEEQCDEMNKNLEMLRREYSQIGANRKKFQLSEQIQELQSKKCLLSQELQKKRQNMDYSLQQKKQKVQEQQIKYNEINREYEQKLQQIRLLQEIIKALSTEVKGKQQKITQCKAQIQQIQTYKNTIQSNSGNELKHIFMGDILTEPYYKHYLINEICKLNNTKHTVSSTNLLYSYPKYKKLSFHQEVDNKPNYLLIVKFKNGLIAAAYSQQPLCEGVRNTGKGFLCSLSNERVFYLRKSVEKAKLTQYNHYYIIFGNAELKIKLNDLYAESNLGVTARYFDTEKTIKNPEVLFGQPVIKIDVQSYEIFQVVFGQKQ